MLWLQHSCTGSGAQLGPGALLNPVPQAGAERGGPAFPLTDGLLLQTGVGFGN